jgi:hypothetical protein
MEMSLYPYKHVLSFDAGLCAVHQWDCIANLKYGSYKKDADQVSGIIKLVSSEKECARCILTKHVGDLSNPDQIGNFIKYTCDHGDCWKRIIIHLHNNKKDFLLYVISIKRIPLEAIIVPCKYPNIAFPDILEYYIQKYDIPLHDLPKTIGMLEMYSKYYKDPKRYICLANYMILLCDFVKLKGLNIACLAIQKCRTCIVTIHLWRDLLISIIVLENDISILKGLPYDIKLQIAYCYDDLENK